MSASRIPTVRPSAFRPRARLQAVVDLPTPPLPDATATTCRTPGMSCALAAGGLAGRPGVALGAFGRLPDGLEGGGLARLDGDREHDAAAIDENLGQAPGRDQALPVAEPDRRERLQDLFTARGQGNLCRRGSGYALSCKRFT